jgi:hypothetical protein
MPLRPRPASWGRPNKTLLLLGNGLIAKLGVRSARKAGRLTELPAGMSPCSTGPRHVDQALRDGHDAPPSTTNVWHPAK